LSLLLAEGISAGYSQLPVIEQMTVRAEAGQIVSIIGPNGSGKSTLLKAIIGLLKPMAGQVHVAGLDVTGWPPHRIVRQGIAYVPQTQNVFASLSVVENLEMGAYARSNDIRPRIENVLAAFPTLAESRRKKAQDLSVGQRNLLGLARALMVDPKVILVDEPTAGLAPNNVQLIWEQLVKIAAEGAGVIVVEQNVDMALKFSDWCFLMVAGRNRLDGPAKKVQQENLNAIFLGEDVTKAAAAEIAER
jgi:ABC-type branched-subunit amino acid transport system ATPase component